MSAKKNRVDFPIYGTKDMIEGYLRVIRRDSRRTWEAFSNWDIPEDTELD